MRKLTHFIFSFLFLVTCYLLLVTQVHAEGEFETDYDVTYTAQEDGRTSVAQNILLRNKTANFYADEFELKIGSTRVEDVKAQDEAGPLETEVNFENNVTSIKVKFNQRVIGLDKSLPWTLNYSSGELAIKSGQIWEISIPRVSDSPDIGSYTSTVVVPESFGQVAFAVPSPNESTASRLTQQFKFEKERLIESGISMSFGEKQVFSFNLNYYLENGNLTTQLQEITLPPDNNYQQVVFESINPKPLNVTVDEDGNYLAQYRLNPKQKLDVNVAGSVEVFSRPFRNVYKNLTEAERERYTQAQRYWEIDNGFIKDKAIELKTPQEIYTYVSGFLSYSQERLNGKTIDRQGAATAILKPENAVCMEFTDLFIAIARAANIPAREVEGFAYTQNERLRPLSLPLAQGDILHAWPQYWDDELGWVQIDPTWGSTSGGLDYFNKLDFNHITFVQRGVSSTTPHPAGAYKRQENLGEKSVFVSFAQELPQPVSAIDLELDIPEKLIGGIPTKAQAIVKNAGNTAIVGGQLELETSLSTIDDKNKTIEILPPFSEEKATYSLQTTSFFTRGEQTVSLSFGDSSVTKTVQIVPIYFLFFSKGFIVSAIIAAVVITLGFLLFKKFQKKPRPPQD